VKAATVNVGFLQKVIFDIAKEWTKNEAVLIQTTEAEVLLNYFKTNAKELLQKGVKIEQVSGKKTSFTIMPADGAYKICFGEDEFIAYFKEFLRPQLIELLF